MKILLDIIDLIIYLQLRKKMAGTDTSITEMLGNAQSPMCHRTKGRDINIEPPNKQLKEMAKKLDIAIPADLKMEQLRQAVLGSGKIQC